MLLPRVLTAVVGVPLLLYLIHLGGLAYWGLCVATAVLALHEYGTVLWLGGRGVQRALLCVIGGLLSAAVGLSGTSAGLGEGAAPLALTLLISSAMLREVLRGEHSLDRAALTALGGLFIAWPLGHLPLLRQRAPNGECLTYLLFSCVWSTDTFAYFAGRLFGRRKLAAALSPKKTWEGAAGGLLGALGAALLVRRFLLAQVLSVPAALSLGALAGVVGQLSDVSQSLVKRAAGAKDSGTLLPGHGGVFDRMDSFLLLSPLFYWLSVLLGL